MNTPMIDRLRDETNLSIKIFKYSKTLRLLAIEPPGLFNCQYLIREEAQQLIDELQAMVNEMEETK